MKKFINSFLKESENISRNLDVTKIALMVKTKKSCKKNKGRIFFLGVGGSAANCSHAVNDFRKLCNIESYSPTDNVSELTARINDESWEESLVGWLKTSNLSMNDCLFIMSVGGGNIEKKVSVNLVNAVNYGLKKKSKIVGIVGKDGGYTAKKSNNVFIVPVAKDKLITPLTESYHAVIWHCIVSHPMLQKNKTKW